MKLDIYQVDAFANKPFEGNPAAVVPLTEWLSDDLLQNIAAENNLAETAFFIKTPKGFHLRWFTPTVEIPLCGHATLASAFILFTELGYDQDEIVFESMSGDLIVRKQGEKIVLNFPAYTAKPAPVPSGLQDALGVQVDQYLKSDDSIFGLVCVSQEDEVKKCTPDFAALKDIASGNFIVTARAQDYDFVSRVFVPEHGIDEDPVTGSAHCVSAPYWASVLQKNTLNARQVSTRGGDILCHLENDRLDMAGTAVLYLKGHIYV